MQPDDQEIQAEVRLAAQRLRLPLTDAELDRIVPMVRDLWASAERLRGVLDAAERPPATPSGRA